MLIVRLVSLQFDFAVYFMFPCHPSCGSQISQIRTEGCCGCQLFYHLVPYTHIVCKHPVHILRSRAPHSHPRAHDASSTGNRVRLYCFLLFVFSPSCVWSSVVGPSLLETKTTRPHCCSCPFAHLPSLLIGGSLCDCLKRQTSDERSVEIDVKLPFVGLSLSSIGVVCLALTVMIL